jgi:sensory rhodopsin
VIPDVAVFTFGAVSLLVGTAVAARLTFADDETAGSGRFQYLLIIPGVATVAYLIMALDIGTLTVGSQTIILPRYVDWLLTTPVMMGYAGYVAGAPRRWIATIAGSIAVVIAVGAGATVATGPTKWALFTASSVVQLGVFWILYRVFPTYAANHPERQGLFWLLQNHVGVLWLAYPLIWVFSPAGLGAISASAATMVIVYMDVVAKTPYVYFVWTHRVAFGPSSATSSESDGVAVAAD